VIASDKVGLQDPWRPPSPYDQHTSHIPSSTKPGSIWHHTWLQDLMITSRPLQIN